MGGLLFGCLLLVYGFWVASVLTTSPAAAVANVVVAGSLLLLARRAGTSWENLGLGRSALVRGLRWGAFGSLATALVVLSVAALEPGVLHCGAARIAGVDLPVLLFHVLLRAPLATAAAEEVMFRGVLVASLEKSLSQKTAGVVSSLFFGLWHVAPTLALLGEAADLPGCPRAPVPAVAATVAFTFAGGLLLWFLRRRSGSLAAPILVHATYNSIGLAAAYATSSST